MPDLDPELAKRLPKWLVWVLERKREKERKRSWSRPSSSAEDPSALRGVCTTPSRRRGASLEPPWDPQKDLLGA